MPPNDPGGVPGLLPSYNLMQMQQGVLPSTLQPMPQTIHPGQVSAMLQQQAMMFQYSAPRPSAVFGSTPAYLPGIMSPSLPPPMFGGAAGARQRAIDEQNHTLALAQTGAGLTARLAGGVAAGMMMGPVNALGFEMLGGGAALQRGVGNLFEPLIAQRERALNLQNMSTRFVTGGSMLSATGQGMSMSAAQYVSNNIGRMADSSQFRRDTGNMFNRADLDRITRLSGELGMLDQAQNADQMIREVKKVSKALSNFMKLAEEPDIQRAMQQMARLRTLGFSAMEMPTAAANARTFARMAGVTIEEAMSNAEKGASIFQGAGLSGAAGFNAGLGAQGAARQLAATMDPRRLSMAGGVEGIQNTILQASASSQTIDAFLPAMLTRRNGQLAIDPQRLQQMLSGRFTPSDMARMGNANIHGLGGRMAVQELFTRRRELQDEMSSQLTPEQQTLMPLLMARNLQRQTGMTLGASLRMIPGMGEEQAHTLEQMAESPDFARRMRQQMTASRREAAARARAQRRSEDTLSYRVGSTLNERLFEPLGDIANRATDIVGRHLSGDQDAQEALELMGPGPARVVGRSRYGTDITAAHTRQMMRSNSGMIDRYARSALDYAERGSHAEDHRAATISQIPFARMFYGPNGWGLDRASRGGETTRAAIIDSAGWRMQMRESIGFGLGPSVGEVNRLGREQSALGRLVTDRGGTVEERHARAQGATRDLGTMTQSQQSKALAVATVAARQYAESRDWGPFGMFRQDATASGMRQQVAQALRAQGFGEGEVNRALQSDQFMHQAMEDARATTTSRGAAAFARMQGAGEQTDAANAGQTASQLRTLGERQRSHAAYLLGMGRAGSFLGPNDSDVRGVVGVLGGTNDEAQLRRKIFAAYMMTQSSKAGDKAAGTRMLQDLQRSTRDPQQYARALAAVQDQLGRGGQAGSMSSSARARMIEGIEGKSGQEVLAMVESAGEYANRSGGSDAMAARNDLLGKEAGAAYTRGGIAGLRANAAQIKNRRIRSMVEGNATDDQIRAAVEGGARERVAAGEATAEGAGAGQDTESDATTEAMLQSISEGMENFPGAIQRLDEASQKLSETADRLADAAGIARAAGTVEAGGGGSNGFSLTGFLDRLIGG